MAALPHLTWCEPCHQDLSADHGASTTSKASNINSDWIKKKDFFLKVYLFLFNYLVLISTKTPGMKEDVSIKNVEFI